MDTTADPLATSAQEASVAVVEAAVAAPPTQVETVQAAAVEEVERQAAAVEAVERPRKMLRLTHLNPVVVAPAKPPASEPASDSEESAASEISSIEVDFRDLQLGSSWVLLAPRRGLRTAS